MEARGLALDISHDVPRLQLRETDRATTEPIGEKPADEEAVIDDRRARQRPIDAQILLERLHDVLDRRQSGWRDLFRWNHAAAAQKIDELSECGRIVPATSPASSA